MSKPKATSLSRADVSPGFGLGSIPKSLRRIFKAHRSGLVRNPVLLVLTAHDPAKSILRPEENDVSAEQIDRIIQAFDSSPKTYRRAEMEEAVRLRDDIIPRLLEILEELAVSPEKYVDGNRLLHTYAVTLLSHFREPRAHLSIIRAFTLDHETVDGLWGDVTTETLPVLLYQTCDGKLDAIKDLVLNKNADEYVRSAAMHALNFAVVRGDIQREEVLAFYGALFTGTEAERGSGFWSMLTSRASDLWPEELASTIKKAYDDGLIFSGFIGWDDVQRALDRGKDGCLRRARARADDSIPQDVHRYLSWFSCFRSQENRPAASDDQQRRSDRDRERAKKKAKKLAEKSRKRNRGR
ncbi:MAG: DUF1186 domain-containing protein [Myxococcales bacterium]|nr:DUF1186 domain-containing protein [Myxococcales bacterium]